MTPYPTPPLTNLQAELLRLFPYVRGEEKLLAIRDMISRYLMEKAMDEADRVAEERGYTDADFERMLNN